MGWLVSVKCHQGYCGYYRLHSVWLDKSAFTNQSNVHILDHLVPWWFGGMINTYRLKLHAPSPHLIGPRIRVSPSWTLDSTNRWHGHLYQFFGIIRHKRCGESKTGRRSYLENLFKMRPAGVLQRQSRQYTPLQEGIQDLRFKEAHRRSEDGKSHSFMEFPRCLLRNFRVSLRQLHHASIRLTSIEQNIQSIKVCTTLRAAEPMPKPKYTPIYLPTWGLCPSLPLTSAQFLSQTLPPVKDQHFKQAKGVFWIPSCTKGNKIWQSFKKMEINSPICNVCPPINISP